MLAGDEDQQWLDSVNSCLLQLFDPDFYLSQFKNTVAPVTDPFYHFLSLGWWLGLDPHPLFSVSYYIAQKPEVQAQGLCPLVHYVSEWQSESVRPHILFDSEYYCSQLESQQMVCKQNPLIHFIEGGYLHASPHPLFDPAFYMEQVFHGDPKAVLIAPSGDQSTDLSRECYQALLGSTPEALHLNPMLHYLTEGWQQDRNPHPLFCGRYYFSQCPEQEQGEQEPLSAYLAEGWTLQRSPHPLFDVSYVRRQMPPEVSGEPLQYYLAEGHNYYSSHPLFDREHYRQQAIGHGHTDIATALVAHYISHGHRENLNPHLLFDNPYYAMNYMRGFSDRQDPLSYFIEYGSEQGHNPHPFFDTTFYQSMYAGELGEGELPLQHYIENVADRADLATCWGVDFKRCIDTFADFDRRSEFIPSYLMTHFYCDPSESEYLSGRAYSPIDQLWKSVFGSKDSQIGISRGVAPFRALLTCRSSETSDEALSLLRVAEVMKRKYEIDCYFFFEEGGDLTDEFTRLGEVVIAADVKEDKAIGNLSALILAINRAGRTFALCASLHEGYLGRLCASLGVPTFGLVSTDNEILKDVTEDDGIVYRKIFSLGPVGEDHECGVLRMLEHCPECIRYPELFMPSSSAARSKLLDPGLRTAAAVVVAGGNRSDFRDFSNFLNLLNLLAENNPELDIAPFWIQGGSGDADQQLYGEALRASRGTDLIDQLRIVDRSSEALRCLEAADVFVHCSNRNRISHEALGAMAAGTPLVGFNSDLSAEHLFTAIDSKIIAQYDFHSLARELLLILNGKQTAATAGLEAQGYIRKTHSPLATADSILEAVSENMMKAKIGLFENADLMKIKQRRKPIHVFVTVDFWGISGVNVGAEHVVNGLNQRGWIAEMLFLRNGSVIDGFGPSCPHRVLGFHGVRTLREAWETYQNFLIEHSPCIVLCSNDRMFMSIAPALPDNVGLIGKYENDLSPVYASFVDLGRYCNRSIGTSQHIVNNLIDLQPELSSSVSYVRSGGLTQAEIDKYGKVQRGKRPLQLIYAGRLSLPQKRVYDFIDLVEQLEAAGLDYRLKLVGEDDSNGDLIRAFQDEWQEHIAAGKISIIRRLDRDALLKKFSESDVFLLLSEFEGLPLALTEAMGCGCVPVVTEIESGVPELVRHEQTGFIVKDRNWEELARYLTDLYEQPSLRGEIATRALDLIRQEFLVETTVDAHHTVISEVAEEMSAGFRRPEHRRYHTGYRDVLPALDFFSKIPRRIIDVDEWRRGSVMDLDSYHR